MTEHSDAESRGGVDRRVVFTPSGIEVGVPVGTSLLDAARTGGVDLDSVCGGRGLCGRCQVVPALGHHAKWGISVDAGALTPPGSVEAEYRGRRPLAGDNRLGCQALVNADVVVDVPAASAVRRPVVRKAIDLGDVVLDPIVTLHYLALSPPVLGEEVSDAERVVSALGDDWGLHDVAVPPVVLAGLQAAVRAGDGAVTAVVADRRRLLAVRPGYSDEAWGVAIDVGSTTLAGYLLDLASGEVVATAGRMNPQIRFGEDLMSRVSYVMMNPGGAAALTGAVQDALDELVGELCEQVSASRDHVHDTVVVGNPIMHHLVLGLDPTSLGTAPFTLAERRSVRAAAADVGLALRHASLYVAPCIAGHVGADSAAATLAEGPHRVAHPQLLVDVGTNAEIVLGDGERVFAASSPTGPAFEGAQISCGQRATAGAIERVRIDAGSLEPRFKVIGCDVWSDDPTFEAALGSLQVSGVCGSGIIDVVAEMFLAGIIDRHGVVQGSLAERTPRIVPDGRTFAYELQSEPVRLRITQNDVRAIQLAKAALRAGIDLLTEHAGLAEVHDIRLAGAFGAHIDPVRALVLGLVPDAPVAGVRSAGNASGAGAARLLLSRAQRREVEQLSERIVKIESATEARFQELFVAAMAFPHGTAPTTHLARVVDLPPAGDAEPAGVTGARRRPRRHSGEEPAPDSIRGRNP
ncbi:MAG: ASKHA domain-containing protein [bacterium]|nr:ASKHA domain-containing protein [bacterium]